MENYFRDELKAGKQVSMKIDVGYAVPGSARPSEFVVRAVIDGQPWIKRFTQ